MAIDISKLSRIYENSYLLLLKEIKNEKISFYLLNDILIFICIGKVFNDEYRDIEYELYKMKIIEYEKEIKTNIFFDSYFNIDVDNKTFKKIYKKFFDELNSEDKYSIDTIQETLGYVLEKHINRKETGSYYTPSDTTKYITEYSILLRAISKLNNKTKKKIINTLNIKDLYEIIKNNISINLIIEILLNQLDEKEKEELNQKILDLKIIDPTCGSGAFLMNAFDFILNTYKTVNNLKKVEEDIVIKILNTLYGLDNSEEAIILLKMRIILKLLSINIFSNKINRIFKTHFKLADAFLGSDYVLETTNKTESFDWKEFKCKFDCIIGNPPYVEVRDGNFADFKTINCKNLYAYTIERSYNIAKKDAIISFIVPLPLIGTVRMKPIKDFIIDNSENVFFSSYADRPGCIFKGVHQRLVIFFANKKKTKQCNIYTSSYNYWYNNDDRDKLFKNIRYTNNSFTAIMPKIGNVMEKNIYTKMINNNKTIFEQVDKENYSSEIFLSTRIGLWTKCFSRKPISNEYRLIKCKDEVDKNVMNAFFNSSTFYFLWILVSDCWHVTMNDLKNIKFDIERIKNKEELVRLNKKLEKDLEKNKKYIGSKQVEYEYKHKYSKKIIDEIDDIIDDVYGLTKKEKEYIKKYAYIYRMNNVREEDE